MALLIHLFVTALVFPFVGALVFAGFLIAGHERFANDIGVLFVWSPIFAAFAPFVGWSTFVPLSCLSFLFFRAMATRHAKGPGFWVIAWVLIGAGTGAGYSFMVKERDPVMVRLVASGAIAGLMLAPLHRRVWIGLYPEADPRIQMKDSSEFSSV